MSEHHTYKKVELVGSSTTTIEDAIQNALAEASKSLKHLEWFEVTETRGHIENGNVAHYQVTLKVGFRIASS
ncbi:dodecin domain-containing protein [Pseudomonas fluorescens]|uniref:dodecin n=1 Tax=Pseudomonas fluorescens TaxID=294 RepID=UPI0017834F4E|nr:dodecin [Pseudomonas fluorescens]MBD8149156.1 dodecin domain-containing protein [Pseudomonas fluorescens]MBD8177347.1 dodecin domain-containing protein [Pseudomonas fluorescens]MBD8746123.1 dodecin domain-containing protein [Pseudomonas fluorescens]MBD8750379.1 dodecin domain-containing protein [Pseudomonas fluorescens]MBD8760116.1 dodecin domain-containing protein [Pseudomonas fluorescens]